MYKVTKKRSKIGTQEMANARVLQRTVKAPTLPKLGFLAEPKEHTAMHFHKNAAFADDRSQWQAEGVDGSFFVINKRRRNGRDQWEAKWYKSTDDSPWVLGTYFSQMLAEKACESQAKKLDLLKQKGTKPDA